MIAICVPSRGLIYSQTVQSVIKGMQELNKNGFETDYFPTHDQFIPAAHNDCVKQALQNKAVEKLLFIEEDNFLFPEAFVALAKSEKDITTLQYNDKNGSPWGILHYNEAGELLWGGLGATIINRAVFEKLGEPYFRTDNRYRVTKKHIEDGKAITQYELIEPRQEWDNKENKFVEVKDEYKYGGLDIDFYTRARRAGFTIGVLTEFKAHHFKLVKLAESYTNHGVHDIQQV